MKTFAFEFTAPSHTSQKSEGERVIMLWDFETDREATDHLLEMMNQHTARSVRLLGVYDRLIMQSKSRLPVTKYDL